MKSEPETQKEKKPYEAPSCRMISLRPEEAVLGNCKSMFVSGPSLPVCNATGGCSAIRS
jgi:hypothetical protein